MSAEISRRLALSGLAMGFAPALAQQERYPAKPLTLVAPFPPGASTDLVGRALARSMAESFGVPVVVENRPGAGGAVGSEYVARQRPDGYVIQVVINATHGLISLFNRNVPYDPLRDFSYVSLVASAPTALYANPALPARTLAELLDYARRQPRGVEVGSSGIGSHHHLAAELLRQKTGANFIHVPFRGGGEAATNVMANHIPLAFGTLSTVLEPSRSGQVRLLAVMDDARSEAVPEVPTVAETIPGYHVPSVLLGIVGPAGLPAPVVARLNEAINGALRTNEVRRVFADAGVQGIGSTPEAFHARFADDLAAFRQIVDAAGIRPE